MTDLVPSAMHEAVLTALRAQFPDMQTVADYRDLADDFESLPLPAILAEMTDLEWSGLEADDGTGRLAVDTVWDLTIIMGFRTALVERALRDFAGALAVFIHGNRWGLRDVEPAVFTLAGLHEFAPALPSHLAWRVEFRQRVYLGTNVWINDGSVPQALFSWDPEIGIPHEGDYLPVVPEVPE